MEIKTRLPLPKSQFNIDDKSFIKLSLCYNDRMWGTGINNLLEHNQKYPGEITCEIRVYILDHILNTPLGGMASYDVNSDYSLITKEIKSYDDFAKLSNDVENKMLTYFN